MASIRWIGLAICSLFVSGPSFAGNEAEEAFINGFLQSEIHFRKCSKVDPGTRILAIKTPQSAVAFPMIVVSGGRLMFSGEYIVGNGFSAYYWSGMEFDKFKNLLPTELRKIALAGATMVEPDIGHSVLHTEYGSWFVGLSNFVWHSGHRDIADRLHTFFDDRYCPSR